MGKLIAYARQMEPEILLINGKMQERAFQFSNVSNQFKNQHITQHAGHSKGFL